MVDPNKEGGIVDVEFEPNSELWRWLAIHQRLIPEEVQAFEVTIATGFIGKVCEICVNMETVLRQQVKTYLQDTTRPRSWAIMTWLLNRGMLDKPFYDFAVPNLGFPDTTPPTDKEIMGLMTKNWERLTNGIAFGDCIVDSAPPVAYSAPLTRHQEPLMRLKQWVQLTEPHSNKKLSVNKPPLPLDLMASDPSVAFLLSKMPTDDQSDDMDHDLDFGAEDYGGNQEHRASDKAYIDEARIRSIANIDDSNDNDSVSSGASYTSYQEPPEKPEFHFHPDKPRSYIMSKRAFFAFSDDNHWQSRIAPKGEGPMKTTGLLEQIAIGSIDPYIALWHLLSEFMLTLRMGKRKTHYGIPEAEWIQVHCFLSIIAKFAATVWKDPKKKYKSKNFAQFSDAFFRPYKKVIDTLLDKMARKPGYSSEAVQFDISEAPIGIVALHYRPIEVGLLDLYMPGISFSEGESGSLIATIKGWAVYNAEWTTQRHRIHSRYRKIDAWKFTAPDFEESFEAAANEGLFVNVMRRSLFGEKEAGLMHGERRVTAHSSVQETSDSNSHSVARVKAKDMRKASALASKHRQPSEKHVRFASSPDVFDITSPHKPWWEIDQDSAGPSGQKESNGSVADDDASMADADDNSDVVDLDDGHGGFVLCDKGGWHYLDEFGSPMGELISLPGLGLEIGSDELGSDEVGDDELGDDELGH
ncbi:hypothetical protein PG989_011261 [Apiospora arundinis]